MIKTGAITGVAVVGVGVSSIVAPNLVSADQADDAREDVFERVIDKLELGVESEELEEAMKEARYEVRSEIMLEMLEAAVTEGSITEAEMDLALEMIEAEELYKEDNRPDFEALKDLSKEERREELEAHRAEMNAEVSSQLGISEDELDELKETLREAGVMLGKKGKGGGQSKLAI